MQTTFRTSAVFVKQNLHPSYEKRTLINFQNLYLNLIRGMKIHDNTRSQKNLKKLAIDLIVKGFVYFKLIFPRYLHVKLFKDKHKLHYDEEFKLIKVQRNHSVHIRMN